MVTTSPPSPDSGASPPALVESLPAFLAFRSSFVELFVRVRFCRKICDCRVKKFCKVKTFLALPSSEVRTSVFGRQTFPALHPIDGWHVTTLWVNCSLWVNQLRQLSLPSINIGKLVVIHVFTCITEVETIKKAHSLGLLRMAAWLQA